MAGNKVWRIRDAVHNLIEFDEIDSLESRLWRVIQTPHFQRLRRIKQLGFSELIYPGATHTRFAHSLGVFHTARRLMAVIKKFEARNQARYEDQHAAPALAAALLHDIGHGMFSHAFEAIGKEFNWAMAKHEEVSQKLILEGKIAEILNSYYDGFAKNVAEIIKDNKDKQIPPNIFHAIVSSQFDADRLDYMQRDRLMTGIRSSHVDMEWLLANLEVGDVPIEQDGEIVGKAQTLVLGAKALQTAESYVFGLFHLYPNIYLHKATRGFEMLFQALLRRLVYLVGAEQLAATGLVETHPLIKFIYNPDDLNLVLDLDDSILWGSLYLLQRAPDDYIKKCAAALAQRLPLRAIDIREKIAAKLGDKSPQNTEKIDRISELVLSEIKERHAQPDRLILCDQAGRVPYKQAKKDEVNAYMTPIWLRRGGNIADIRDLAPSIRFAEKYTIYRAYIFRDENEQRLKGEITAIINRVSDNA